MKKIFILGITGSIGQSTVEVVRAHPDKFKIVGASAHRNVRKLEQLAKEFHIKNLVLTSELTKNELPSDVKIHTGEDALLDLVRNSDYDILLNAIAGSAGLKSSIETLKRGKNLALANKESLVMAGHLVRKIQSETGAKLLPVDSEHSAIFQILHNKKNKEVNNLILTASGGPFRNLDKKEFYKITLADTLKHPTWEMGSKITIDSSTLMNKGLEVIEAHWLYDIDYDHIQAVIHPQSIIHSMVEFIDGSIFAQMSEPTMRLPILYALTYPNRIKSNIVSTNMFKMRDLTFMEISTDKYPLFKLANEVGKAGGILPTIMNAVNEIAVQLFIEGKITYLDIPKMVINYVEQSDNIANPDLNSILELNSLTHNDAYLKFRSYL
jgi:1-deoxy-D-xylulose-5-phosphate reductoisomerase